MRKLRIALCTAMLIAGTATMNAWTPQAPQEDQKSVKTPNPTVIAGTVKAYEPGKSIEVDAKGSPQTYNLSSTDMTVTVSPTVKVGSKVKVTETADATGRKTVSIDADAGSN